MSEVSASPCAAMMPLPRMAGALQDLIGPSFGAGAVVANLAVMADGHAGLTYGFDVLSSSGSPAGGYVLKLAPAGVTRRGNTDVYRQAPLLRALKRVGLLVPDVPWASPDDDLLGAPFIVMERLPGRVFIVWEPHASFSRVPAKLQLLWVESAKVLAHLHQVDWNRVLPDWEAPQPLRAELARWPSVLRHAQDPSWLAAGAALGDALESSLPDGQPIGIVHGDFQPGNILFESGAAVGLIDWELASIGSQGLDVGWLLMMSDPAAWDADWRPIAPIGGDEIVSTYRNAGGPAWRHLAWYQALAHYRLGAIACLNVKLHRTGKRVDDLWERFAPSIATLFARGLELVAAAPARGAL
jgi:aminoglycoside phosphotransferase (APT) family kinase protein